MKLLFILCLISLFTFGLTGLSSGVKYLLTFNIALKHITRYFERHPNAINRNNQNQEWTESQEAFRKYLNGLMPKIRNLSNNNQTTDDDELGLLEDLFPVTFIVQNEKISFDLKNYLPEILFPAIAKVAEKSYLDHFCIEDFGISHYFYPNDESIVLLLPFIIDNRNSTINIYFRCSLNLVSHLTIAKIRNFANWESTDDYEIHDLKDFFPVTFTFYGQTLTLPLSNYLPETLFPAIGKALERPNLDHFCIKVASNSYAVTKNDESLSMLLQFLINRNQSSIEILLCPLDLNPPMQ